MEATIATTAKQKLVVYSIIERDGLDRAYWANVGRAFRNRDGSYNIHLDALPTNGKLHMREFDPNKARGERSEKEAEVRS
jgi:hypothetical protein